MPTRPCKPIESKLDLSKAVCLDNEKFAFEGNDFASKGSSLLVNVRVCNKDTMRRTKRKCKSRKVRQRLMKKLPNLRVMVFYNQTFLDLEDPNEYRKGSLYFPLSSPIHLKEDFTPRKHRLVPTAYMRMSVTDVTQITSLLQLFHPLEN